ncbi:hypothetical protein [Xanthobacter sediminis]
MLNRIVFQDNMEALAGDENALQGYVQQWGDLLVSDFLQGSGARGYAGLTVTRRSTSVVSVAPGRLYDGAGRMFGLDAAADVDLTPYFPAVSPRIVAIVCYGDTVIGNATVRNFVDPSTEEAVPKTVDLESRRVVKLTVVAGAEAGTPVAPAINATYLGVAYVCLTPAGIAAQSAITQLANNEITALADLAVRIGSLEDWQRAEVAVTAALRSDLSALARRLEGLASTAAITRIAKEVARLRESVGLPDTYSSSRCDAFMDTAECWTTHPEWRAKVEDGVRFAEANVSETPIALLSSIDANVTVSPGGLLLPKYTEIITLSIGDQADERDTEIAIAQYQTSTISGQMLLLSRLRQRYGEEYVVCTNSRYWQTGEYNNAGIFMKDGENWEVSGDASVNHKYVRTTRFFEDYWADAYWDYGAREKAVTGKCLAQTRLATATRWVTGYALWFSQVAPAGDVTLLVTGVSDHDGKPDFGTIYSSVTLPVASLVEGGWTKFALEPFVALAGYRYAIVVVTVGNHFLQISNNNDFTQGTLYTFVDNDFAIAMPDRDMCLQEYCAKFISTSTLVDLQPWNLDGGIASVDVMAPCWRSENAKITWQFQNTNKWYNLAEITGTSPFVGLPALVRARLAMTHTQDIAPGIRLDTSRVRLSRPRTDGRYISVDWRPAAGITSLSVTFLLSSYDPAYHTAVPKLRHSSGDEVVDDAVSVSTRVRNDGLTEMTAVFEDLTGGAGAAHFAWQMDFTTTSALKPFVIEEAADFGI